MVKGALSRDHGNPTEVYRPRTLNDKNYDATQPAQGELRSLLDKARLVFASLSPNRHARITLARREGIVLETLLRFYVSFCLFVWVS